VADLRALLFQARKFAEESVREAIRAAPTPMDAAAMGRSRARALRPDWEAVKAAVMREAVLAKFSQHPDLRRALLWTGEATLVEHTRRDTVWGDGGDGRGRNLLGRILMDARARLRAEAAALAEAPPPVRAVLAALLDWLALGVPPAPNAWWRDQLASRLAPLDRPTLVEWLGRLLPPFAATASPGEIGQSALLGLVYAAGALDGDPLVPAVAAALEAAWIPAPGTGIRAPAAGSACLPILARSPAGRARLRSLQPRLESRPLRQQIEAALGQPEAG
jgi:ribA/ribD-fused uncharacterized protein